MPELAEVEFNRRQWDAGLGRMVTAVYVHPSARIYREGPALELARALLGQTLVRGHTHGKQMLWEFTGGVWMQLHLGMSGELRSRSADLTPSRHDHLILRQDGQALVFNDERMFGLATLHRAEGFPAWWLGLPPQVTDPAWTPAHLERFLRRRARTPIKSALLDQEGFPGIGNWMADEILWRASLHPLSLCGGLGHAARQVLWEQTRAVATDALRAIGGVGEEGLPPDMNARVPRTWLFWHRHAKGTCPRTGRPLQHLVIGGRSTYFEAQRQAHA